MSAANKADSAICKETALYFFEAGADTYGIYGFIGGLTLAALTAVLAAYLSYINTKKQRVLIDRYETLRDTLNHVEQIGLHYGARHLANCGIESLSPGEIKIISGDISASKILLAKCISKLRLLFKEKDLFLIINAHNQLRSKFEAYYALDLDQDDTTMLEDIATITSSMSENIIQLAQQKML